MPTRPRTLIEVVEVLPCAEQAMRRKTAIELQDAAAFTSRRRRGAILMAIISVGLLCFRRSEYDQPISLVAELLFCSGVTLFAYYISGAKSAKSSRLKKIEGHENEKDLRLFVLIAIVLASPWGIDIVGRRLGLGNPMEIVLLSSLAWGGVAASVVGKDSRTIGLSVVCSGFLTLFITFISDSPAAAIFAYMWGVLCLWWLVANHWEKVDSVVASSVKSSTSRQWSMLALGSIIFFAVTTSAANRIPVLRKLKSEIMPTSGGTGTKDSTAQSGVGDGDAIIAAREHASSFGAVDTDLFLDSEKPSLFDIFSDEFGEPKKKDTIEKAQALAPMNPSGDEGKIAEANRATDNDSFSTQREQPRKRPELNDLPSNALFFWSGQHGIRLAVARYSRFDGNDWQNPSASAPLSDFGSTPVSMKIGKQTWFKPTGRAIQNSISPFVDAFPEAIKFTRYRSTVVPTRAGTQLWSIEQVDRADFFAVDKQNILSMPNRQHIPDYTTIRFVNSQLDIERVEELLKSCSPGESHFILSDQCKSTVAKLAHRYAGDEPRGWSQVDAIVQTLRSDYCLDRNFAPPVLHSVKTESPLEQFLDQKRGPSYLFATAAALMLQHLGYEIRLVAGFYVAPGNRTPGGDFAVLSGDAHVWLEINAGHGYWIPLEPTPGYQLPPTTASIWYRLNQAKLTIALWLFTVVSTSIGIYFLRRILFELLCRAVWPVITLLSDRQRIVWLSSVLDMRLRLAGTPRSAGVLLRQKLLQSSVGPSFGLAQRGHPDALGISSRDQEEQLQRFLDESDHIVFGGAKTLTPDGRKAIKYIWNSVTTFSISRNYPSILKEPCQ